MALYQSSFLPFALQNQLDLSSARHENSQEEGGRRHPFSDALATQGHLRLASPRPPSSDELWSIQWAGLPAPSEYPALPLRESWLLTSTEDTQVLLGSGAAALDPGCPLVTWAGDLES